MTTITLSPNTIFGVPNTRNRYWDRVWGRAKEMFEKFSGTLKPYFGPPSLDYLDPKYQSTLSIREKAMINGGLLLV